MKYIEDKTINKIIRNIFSIIFDIFVIILSVFLVLYCCATKIESMNWLNLFLGYISIEILRRSALRIRITHVCPQCFENRGVACNYKSTGRTNNYNTYIDGDYWFHSQDVEYIKNTNCLYCSYENQEFCWKKETWQGELTQKAKLKREEERKRKEIEEYKEAQKRARIEAWEEIERRKRRY